MGGWPRELPAALDVVHPSHDMLAGRAEAGVKGVHVTDFFRNIQRNAGSQEEMDVSQPVDQPSEQIEVHESAGAGLSAVRVEDPDGRASGAHMHPIAAQLQIVPAVPSIQAHPPGRLLVPRIGSTRSWDAR